MHEQLFLMKGSCAYSCKQNISTPKSESPGCKAMTREIVKMPSMEYMVYGFDKLDSPTTKGLCV